MAENNVEQYRQAAGLTLAQLSERSGVPVSTICDVEHGTEPSVVTAIRLARALNTTVEQLWPDW